MSSAVEPEERPLAALDWLSAMEEVAEEDGYLEPLGKHHHAFFAETGTTLIVSFEQAETIRTREGHMPEIWPLVQKNKWSLLTLIADGPTWWRAPEVWGYFDRLIDDAFFDDFDQVVFYGAGAGAYAAAAYMVAAPGATALLLAPRATQTPFMAAWDRRDPAARRLDFTSRYGYAPDMTEGARKVWIAYDPTQDMDAMHAALFRRPWVEMLPMRRAGEDPAEMLRAAKIFDRLLVDVVEEKLTLTRFAKLWRARRNLSGYLKTMLTATQTAKRLRFEIGICRSVTQRIRAPRFQRRLEELTAQLNPPETDSLPAKGDTPIDPTA